MFKLKLFLALLALMVLAAGGVMFYLFVRAEEGYEAMDRRIEAAERVRSERGTSAPDLGRPQYEAALGFLQEGERIAARDQLYYVIEYYPDSGSIGDAKRLLGEINADLLFSEIPIEGKIEYTVKRGDALLAIASRHDCTIDYIMRCNGRLSANIFPGDRLFVYPLNFSVTIDLSERLVRVDKADGRLFKEYPITRVALPPMVRAPLDTEVTSRVAWLGENRVSFDEPEYHLASKWLQTGARGLILRADPGEVEPVATEKRGGEDEGESTSEVASEADEAYGLLVSAEDMEELFVVLRGGTPIRLRP